MRENFHRLLKRQLKRFSFGEMLEKNADFNNFLQIVSDAYFDFDQSVKHLENILEVSSNELFKKNQSLDDINKTLEKIVEDRTKQVYEQNIELAQYAEEISAQRDIVEEKASDLERANKLVTQSIQYARRLQDVMLPQKVLLSQLFPAYFLFYRPKDIISGDFYWFFERRDKVIFGVVDCTGHGVPGAFMSLLVNDMLRLIVEFKNIVEPAEILTELHREIKKAFKQESTLNSDGADAAICQWDRKARILRFSGAKLPLFCRESNGEFHILQGSRVSLGGGHLRDNPYFEEYIIHLKQEVSVYLSTDGFYDQLGGEKKQRLGKAKFTGLIKSVAEQPFEEQVTIVEQYFNQWKATFPFQLDDVTVLGLKLNV